MTGEEVAELKIGEMVRVTGDYYTDGIYEVTYLCSLGVMVKMGNNTEPKAVTCKYLSKASKILLRRGQ